MLNNNDKKIINFPIKIDSDNEQLQYIKTTVAELNTYPFHDARFSTNKNIKLGMSIANIANVSNKQYVSFIFHTAFCGSTLMSRLLGSHEKFISIREPSILMEAANLH
jgi:hypothetical protein